MKNSLKSKKRHQKLYRMRGCSRKACNLKHKHSHRKYSGGSNVVIASKPTVPLGSDFGNLAYPYNGKVLPNTALAPTQSQIEKYTGKGGSSCTFGLAPEPSNLAFVTTSNPNGVNPIYPNTGPPPYLGDPYANGFNFLNPITNQRGGNCGCSLPNPTLVGGGRKKIPHRVECKCSVCKRKSMKHMKRKSMSGGGGCNTSNNGIPYPNGSAGTPYVNPSNLPGERYINGDANYYSLNTYKNDVSRQMIDVGANPPFLGFLGGRRKYTGKTKKHRGGSFSNFLAQDLINLGRQFGNGVGNTYNALNGYPSAVSPLPWRDQLTSSKSIPSI